MFKRVPFFFLISLCLFACKKEFEGDRNAQGFPETFTLVDSIYRDPANLLTTTVVAQWWGQSTKGFIVGYEVSIDNQQTWKYTTNQRGIYLLSLPVGQQSGKLPIYVRAIDNLGNKDATPATMVFPVKNSNPAITFDYSTGRKTNTLPGFRLNWIPSDPDGIQDIQSIEVVFNDTNAPSILLPGITIAASFVAQKSGINFDSALQVFVNSKTVPQAERLGGVKYNQLNYIFIRSIDRVGSNSGWKKDSLFIRKPTSDFLMVNDYRSAKTSVQNFYANQLNLLGSPYNQYDVVQDILAELPSDVFTTAKVFDYYKKIIWYSDDPNSSLGLAQLVTGNFFQQNGKMFMILEIPNDFPYNSSLFSFTPVKELVVPPSGAVLRMNIAATATAYIQLGSGWPVIKSTSIISNARPFYTFTSGTGSFAYDSLYTSSLLSQTSSGTTNWTGVSNVMSKRIKSSSNTPDLVFASLPLHRLNGNNNMDSLLRKVLIDELKF